MEKTGALRVVTSTKRCARGEKAIAWNQQGPVGPIGPQGSKGDPGPAGPQGLKGAPGLPATSLWAAVRADGTNSRGSGVVSTKKIATGFYEVTFKQDVTQCDFISSLGNPDTLEITGGQIGAAQNIGGGFSNLSTQVLTATSNSAGTPVDMPFFLTVIC